MVPDGRVSKAHARLAFEPGAGVWFLEDLGSTNGTRLDGVPLSAPERLRDLHVVTLGGRHDFIFVALRTEVPSIGRAQDEADPGTRHEVPPALAVPPLIAGGDSAGTSAHGSPSPPAPDGPPSGAGTRHEPLSVLSVPPMVEGGGAPADAPSPDEPLSGTGTRHEPLSVVSVPPLVEGSGAPNEASPPAPDASSAADESPSGTGTRHEPLSVVSVPPLVEGGGAPGGRVAGRGGGVAGCGRAAVRDGDAARAAVGGVGPAPGRR